MELRATTRTIPGNLAGKIAHTIRNGEEVSITSAGPEATYLGLKSIIIARGMLAENGENIIIIPGFVSAIDNEGKETKIIKMRLECV